MASNGEGRAATGQSRFRHRSLTESVVIHRRRSILLYPSFMGELKLPNSVSLEFVEALYSDFLRDPESVPPDWRSYFQSLSDGNSTSSFKPSFKPSGNGAVTEETATALLQE